MTLIEVAAWGALGALLGEAIKSWETLRKIGDQRLKDLLTSFKFWVLFFLVCIMGAVASVIINSDTVANTTHAQAIAAGLSAFGFLRGLAGVASQSNDDSVDPDDPHFGPSSAFLSHEIRWKDVL